jgi:hypothetical protein
MSLIKKQLIMNEIRLPTDMINVIKEYCFYNIEEITKKNKLKLNQVILSAELTRANRYNNDENYSDADPHWVFGFDWLYNMFLEKTQLQAIMCVNCGDYIETTTNCMSNRVRCKCHDDIWENESDGLFNEDMLYDEGHVALTEVNNEDWENFYENLDNLYADA